MTTAIANKSEHSIAVLNAALEFFRKEYRERYIASYAHRLNSLQKKLKEANLDIEKVYPYPSSNQDRKSYVQAKNAYSWSRMVTEPLPLGTAPYDVEVQYGDRKFWSRREGHHIGAPRYVQVKESAWLAAREQAIKDADASIDGYIRKLVGKIEATGITIQAAEYDGNLWFGSILKVTCDDGSVQNWKTKCILNVSCLGTVFNQWPTRRVS